MHFNSVIILLCLEILIAIEQVVFIPNRLLLERLTNLFSSGLLGLGLDFLPKWLLFFCFLRLLLFKV